MSDYTHPLLFVTGLSGAGMSTTLKHLEDMGYEAFDNFPLTLVDQLLDDPDAKGQAIAIGIDSRTRGFDDDTLRDQIKSRGARLLFLSADENILLKRFTETRRKHPLAKDRPASSGIKHEQERMFDLRSEADIVVDTSNLSIHDLRHILEGHCKQGSDTRMAITVMSFGFKYGTPREADIIMDVRFMKNPNWVPELKHLRGTDQAVADYVAKDKNFESFINGFQSLLKPLLPRYDEEGKSYLTIAIGCTGGHHRSVFSAETMSKWMIDQGHPTHIVHRDIAR